MTFRLTPALILALALAGPVAAAPEIGQPAPDFAVVDTQGAVRTLSEFAGQTVILEWTNHDCPFVVKHYRPGNMQNQQRIAREEHDAVWLTIISSRAGEQGHVTAEEADELTASRNAFPTAVLLDEDGTMGRAFDARVTPHMYIIDADGILVYMGGIDSNPSANSDDIAGATQYVMVALEEMAAGLPISNPVTRPYGCTIKY